MTEPEFDGATFHRTICAAVLHATAEFVPYLNVEGLQHLRAWLRHADTAQTLAGTAASTERFYWLEQVCRRLVELGHGDMTYYRTCGDCIPDEIPDDISALG